MGNSCTCSPEFCESVILSKDDSSKTNCQCYNKSKCNIYDYNDYRDEYVEKLVMGYIKIIASNKQRIRIPNDISLLCSTFYSKPAAILCIWQQIRNLNEVQDTLSIYDLNSDKVYPLKLMDKENNIKDLRNEHGLDHRINVVQHIVRKTSKIPHCFDSFDLKNNKEYNIILSMGGNLISYKKCQDIGDIIIFDANFNKTDNVINAYHVGFDCDGLVNRYNTETNMLVNDDKNNIFGILDNTVYQFNMNDLKQTALQKKLKLKHRESTICIVPECNSMIIMGGNACAIDPKFDASYSCSNRHKTINLGEIYSFSAINDEGYHGLIANMNCERLKAGCVYNEYYKNVIVGGGEHFYHTNHGLKHYNHTFEIYDITKNEWKLLSNKLNFEYGDYPSVWIDSFNPNLVYIMNNNFMEFVDIRENNTFSYFQRNTMMEELKLKYNNQIEIKSCFHYF